ncbi:MAG TPA: Rho termination factor N-terminal domain-containing protein [Solirubrobacterales bacterium]|nr:Rho termination factor N-terminal domain-containing protein [Solirubrobacterales bacterium]
MTKTELENKHIAELHTLAAEAGVERYRMLPRAELIAKLAGDDSGSSSGSAPSRESSSGRQPAAGGREQRDRPPRRRRRSGSKDEAGGESRGSGREPRAPRQPERAPEPPSAPPAAAAPVPAAAPESSSRPKRRRRRRFGRRGKQEGVTLQGLLLPPEAGRQALLCAETREACTALLRGIAADLSADSNGGPDPVALLVDPSPEELAEWRRDAPKAEIVAAGQPRHASDALAQASARAAAGDDVILLVDSLTRLGEAYEDADAAKQFFDAGRVASGSGSLTVVAALERPST